MSVLIRLVHLTIAPAKVDEFLAHFDEKSDEIRAFDGCEHLELWQSERYPGRMTTFSKWQDEEALDDYRRSILFKETWSTVKPLFAAPAQASSYRLKRGKASGSDAPAE